MRLPTLTWALLLATVLAQAQESRPAMRETLVWPQSLGAAEVAGRPYVHVYLRDAYRPKERPDHLAHRGFLLDERPGSCRVWCLDLLARRLPPGSEIGWRVERVDLDAGVRDVVNVLRRGDPDEVAGWDRSLSLEDQAAVLAGVCLKVGRRDLCWALCGARSETDSPDFLKDRVSVVLRGHCVRAFGEPDFSRRDLLGIHRKYLADFPHDDERGEVAARAKVLEAMIADDEALQRRPRSEIRSVREETDDLIFELRNVKDPLWPVNSGDSRWPLEPHRWEPGGTMSQLIGIGQQAVPQLIDAFVDERPTRCVDPDFGSFTRAEGHVNRVGSYALAIVEEIARCRFYAKDPAAGWAGLQSNVREWWKQLQAEGEAAAMAALVESGGSNALGAAKRLAQLDPDRAAAVLPTVIDRAEGPQRRGDLVIVIGNLPRDAVIPKLLDLVDNPLDLRSRLEAAKALHRRGRPEGLAAMIREWNRKALSWEGGAFYDRISDTWWPVHPFLDHGYGTWGGRVAGELAAFLGSTNDPAAGAALLEKLEHGTELHRWAALCAGLSRSAEARPRDPSLLRLREECQSLLIDELGNQGLSGASVTTNDFLVVGAPIEDQKHFVLRWCDEAAAWLSRSDPARYAFDWATPVHKRDLQIAAILESWRAEHDADTCPVPESRPETRPGK